MEAGQKSCYYDGDLINFEATELRLGLPERTSSSNTTSSSTSELKSGSKRSRTSSEMQLTDQSTTLPSSKTDCQDTNPTKTQIVGWPPVRSYRKNNTLNIRSQGAFVKVDMDGARYLRKIDLNAYGSYMEMVTAIEGMFKMEMRDDYIPTYQDKDGDWMLAGDVPWEMFVESCKRVRVMKSSDAKGMKGYL